MIILYAQRTDPRFMLPKYLRQKLESEEDQVHAYETDFEDEAARSSASYLSLENRESPSIDFTLLSKEER